MKSVIRELFLTDWVHKATTEEIVEKLIENDERHKEINILKQELRRKDNIINELKELLKNPYNQDCINQNNDFLDKIKELESENE